MTVMTKKEIDKSWAQAKTKNVQNNFPQEMAKRTVINRAAKQFFNTSDDNDLFIDAVNRTTENEYDNDRQIKEAKVVNDKVESLDSILGQPKKVVVSEVENTEQVAPAEPEEVTIIDGVVVAEVETATDTSYPADEIPDFDEETGEIIEDLPLFEQLGDLM